MNNSVISREYMEQFCRTEKQVENILRNEHYSDYEKLIHIMAEVMVPTMDTLYMLKDLRLESEQDPDLKDLPINLEMSSKFHTLIYNSLNPNYPYYVEEWDECFTEEEIGKNMKDSEMIEGIQFEED